MILRIQQMGWWGKGLFAFAGFVTAMSLTVGGLWVVGAAASKPTPPPGPPSDQNKDFAISGDVTVALAPGASQRLDLAFTNRDNFSIQVTAVDIAIDPTTTKSSAANPTCSGTQNLEVVSAFSGSPVAVVIPRNSTRTLSELGIPTAQWPLIRMPYLADNQDGCKGTTFQMKYKGTAVKP